MQTLITTIDRKRINNSLEWLSPQARRGPGFSHLQRRMRESLPVEPGEVPPITVTMNSCVRIRYCSTDDVRELRLIYPNEQAANGQNFDSVSVISPVGAALLGSKVGDVIDWLAPTGPQKGEVLAVLYQPEASGDPD
ncbi:GreA/GreB family elongation factor [Candidatus Sumerlaeota bacterium]|nr:GreA/GreB family elongation factor [Candidatus Sumerlaeota bacterium]